MSVPSSSGRRHPRVGGGGGSDPLPGSARPRSGCRRCSSCRSLGRRRPPRRSSRRRRRRRRLPGRVQATDDPELPAIRGDTEQEYVSEIRPSDLRADRIGSYFSRLGRELGPAAIGAPSSARPSPAPPARLRRRRRRPCGAPRSPLWQLCSNRSLCAREQVEDLVATDAVDVDPLSELGSCDCPSRSKISACSANETENRVIQRGKEGPDRAESSRVDEAVPQCSFEVAAEDACESTHHQRAGE